MTESLFEKFGITADSGKVLFRENETGDRMYIIQEGSIRISKLISGKEHILAVLQKGDFFGEMALVTNTKRTATATAVGTVKLLAFDRDGFLKMVDKNGRLALNIIDKLCRRLQQADLQIQHLVKKNERALVALNLLYGFAESDALDYRKKVGELALNLEIPYDVVLNYLNVMKVEGIIEVENNEMRLVDRYRLTALAEQNDLS